MPCQPPSNACKCDVDLAVAYWGLLLCLAVRGVDLQDLLRVCHSLLKKWSDDAGIQRHPKVQNHVILTRRSLQQVGVMLCKFQDWRIEGLEISRFEGLDQFMGSIVDDRCQYFTPVNEMAVCRRAQMRWGVWPLWALSSTLKSSRRVPTVPKCTVKPGSLWCQTTFLFGSGSFIETSWCQNIVSTFYLGADAFAGSRWQ